MMLGMLSCRQVSDLLSDRLDRDLGPMERLTLRIHLSMCKGCARVEQQFEFLRKAVSGLPKSGDDRDSGRE
jgi:predicted anti-sigma-YlaC factor YlaD